MKKYQEIFNQLQDAIVAQTYPAGSLLPTEKQLQEDYQVSRDTIRKALQMLTEHGLIQKIQGRGSQVIEQELVNFPISGLTSYQELSQSMHLDSRTRVLNLETILVDEKLSQRTGFEAGQEVWRVLRTRTIDGHVAVLDLDFLLVAIVQDLSKEAAASSIYAYLEGEKGLDIAYAQKEITVQPTSEWDRKMMKHKDEYVVLVKSRVYLGDTRQFQYTESRHKIDKFKFVDFARRKHHL